MLLISTLVPLAFGARLTVGPSGDVADLPDALAIALPGDHIVLEPGAYTGGDLSGWEGPIVALDGPGVTLVDGGSGPALLLDGDARLVGLGLRGQTGVQADAGRVDLERVEVLHTQVGLSVAAGATVRADSLLMAGVSGEAAQVDGGWAVLNHVTLVDTGTHLSVSSGGTLNVAGLVGWTTGANTACASGAITVTDGVLGAWTGTTMASCATATRVQLGFNPDFVAFSDDGDYSNDDMLLARGSPGKDDDPTCKDPDGSACDLGHGSGPAQAAFADDLDGDGLPDSWELLMGLDASLVDDGLDDDGDGIDNLGEWLWRTDPLAADSDGDGTDDLQELRGGLDPLDFADGVPVARVSGPSASLVGDLVTFDGGASTDPSGDALTWSWLVTAPDGGTTAQPAGPTSTLQFTPELEGRWDVVVTVSDGVQAHSASAAVEVLGDAVLKVPAEVETLDEALGLAQALAEGGRVELAAGEWTLSVPLTGDVQIIGVGSPLTTVVGEVQVQAGARVVMADLVVTPEGAVEVLAGGLLELHRLVLIGVTGPDDGGIVVEGALVGVDLYVDAAFMLHNEGVSRVVRSRAVAYDGVPVTAASGLVSLEGVVLQSWEFGAVEASGGEVRLTNVSAKGSAGGVSVRMDSGTLEAKLLVLDGYTEVVGCSILADVAVDFVLMDGGQAGTCANIPHFAGALGLTLDDAGVPDSSAWRDQGDPREPDPDGTRPDLGSGGGRWALVSGALGPLGDLEDADGDQITAAAEEVLGTSDVELDSDGDGVQDLEELLSRSDPADPSDHHPTVLLGAGRQRPGETRTLTPVWSDDPDGDPCTFAWEDGTTGSSRVVEAEAPGSLDFGWSLVCGLGRSVGTARVLVEEDLFVPGDAPDLDTAWTLAGDHHVVQLGAGTWEVGQVPPGRVVAMVGAGPATRLVGGVSLEEAAFLQDLTVVGDVLGRGGALDAVAVQGSVWVDDSRVANVLVDEGDLHVGGDTVVDQVTVDGSLLGGALLVSQSAVLGTLLLASGVIGDNWAGDTSHGVVLPLVVGDFIRGGVGPDEAILEPWPGSSLWDVDPDLLDVDGSRGDAGHTGGPGAWPVDADLDRLNDRWEAWHDALEPEDDLDNDGTDNLAEYQVATDPRNPDTDGDGLPDGADPDPTNAGRYGLPLTVLASNWSPEPGEAVTLEAWPQEDRYGRRLDWTWALDPGADANLVADGARATASVSTGTAAVTVTVAAMVDQPDGSSIAVASRSEAVRLSNPNVIQVATTDDLEELLAEARHGDVFLLDRGLYPHSLVVRHDVTFRSVRGPMDTGIDGLSGQPALRVQDGARLTLEGISIWLEDNAVGVELEQGTSLAMRQGRILGGQLSVQVNGPGGAPEVTDPATIDLDSVALLGAAEVLAGQGLVFTGRHVVLGWPLDPRGAAIQVDDAVINLDNAVVAWSQPDQRTGEGLGPWLQCRGPCQARADDVLVVSGSTEGFSVGAQLTGSPGFLMDPFDADPLAKSDLRLDDRSLARDASTSGELDADGTPADLGVHAGPWGDWPDVDNDRDGYLNLDGDCDDFDPTIVPQPFRQDCEEAVCGCAASSAGAGAAWVVALLLGATRRRRRR